MIAGSGPCFFERAQPAFGLIRLVSHVDDEEEGERVLLPVVLDGTEDGAQESQPRVCVASEVFRDELPPRGQAVRARLTLDEAGCLTPATGFFQAVQADVVFVVHELPALYLGPPVSRIEATSCLGLLEFLSRLSYELPLQW